MDIYKVEQIENPNNTLTVKPGQFWKNDGGMWCVRLEHTAGLSVRRYLRKWQAEERADKAVERENKIMKNEKHVGRCNMCEKTWDDATEWEELRECPNCKTDEYLMDLNPEKWEGKKAEHTPGPWQYRPNKYDDWGVVRSADGLPVVQACVGRWSADFDSHRTNGTDPGEANARLIAAAPELLAALERVMECYRMGIDPKNNQAALIQARAAIAKAKGE